MGEGWADRSEPKETDVTQLLTVGEVEFTKMRDITTLYHVSHTQISHSVREGVQRLVTLRGREGVQRLVTLWAVQRLVTLWGRGEGFRGSEGFRG